MPFTDYPPYRDALLELGTDGQPLKSATGRPGWTISRAWLNYITDAILGLLGLAPSVVGYVSRQDVGAAILTTPIATGPLTTGRYRVSCFLRCSRAAGATSSFILTIGVVTRTIAISFPFADVNGNTLTSSVTGVLFFTADAPGPISYAVAYGSTGVPTATFDLEIIVEAIPVPRSA